MTLLLQANAVSETVALKNPTLYIALVFAVVLVGIVLRYISKRDDRDDQRTIAFTKTLTEVSDRSSVAAKQQSDACHAVQREVMNRCENMQSESNDTLKEVSAHLLLHREAMRNCDRCGNYKPKEAT